MTRQEIPSWRKTRWDWDEVEVAPGEGSGADRAAGPVEETAPAWVGAWAGAWAEVALGAVGADRVACRCWNGAPGGAPFLCLVVFCIQYISLVFLLVYSSFRLFFALFSLYCIYLLPHPNPKASP